MSLNILLLMDGYMYDGMNAPQKKLARGCDWREHRLIDCGYGEPASGERETLDRDTEVTPRLCD